MKKILDRFSDYSQVLFFSIATTLLVYFYFFVLSPQSWSLRDDYGFANSWGAAAKEGTLWSLIKQFMNYMTTSGRANYLDPLTRYFFYQFLPLTPRAFHLVCLIKVLIGIGFLGALLKRIGLSTASVFLGVFLVLTNLALKEGIVTLAVSESLASVFLCISLFLFYDKSSRNRWLSAFFFALCLLSKESFVVAVVPFICIGVYRFLKSKKIDYVTLGFVTIAALFTLYVKSLPQGYAAGFGFGKVTFYNVVTSLIKPLVKSFAPLLLMWGILFNLQRRNKRRLSAHQIEALIWGVAIVFFFTVFLNAWGPFDSWFYLHTAIPYGWAVVAAVIFELRSDKQSMSISLSVIAVVAYGILATINGARNYTDFFSNSKTVAEFACEMKRQKPNLKILCNCNEGSAQLQQYLVLEKRCANPPEIQFVGFNHPMPAIQGSALFLHNTGCDQVDLAGFKENAKISLKSWTLYSRD